MYLPIAGRNEKKKNYTYVFGYFPIACVKKKCIYVFFLGDFPAIKKKILLKKCRNGFEPLPKLYCDKRNHIARGDLRVEFVLQ